MLETRECPSCSRQLPVLAFPEPDGPCSTCVATAEIERTTGRGAARATATAQGRAAAQKPPEEVSILELSRRARQEEQARTKAMRELARRELARRHLLAYVKKLDRTYKAGWFHEEVCKHLEWFEQEVIAKRAPVLMLQAPPRHGKSRLVSQEFPAWLLGRNPSWEVISTSHTASLAETFSKKVRERLRDPENQQIFSKCKLDPESQSTQGWLTTKGGGFLPAGIGGPITGRGAHVLLVDDPVKNAEESESQRTRDAHWDWFTSTAFTRLAPGGGLLVIQTRWHLDDLSGRLEELIREEEMPNVRIVRYPAIAEEDEPHRTKGEALHPQRYPVETLERIKKTVGPRVWNALYQQNPVPDSGSYFAAEMLRFYDTAPEHLTYYTAWDFAIGKKEQNDWSVGVTVGVAENGRLYVVDMVRGRWNSYELVEQIIGQYEKWRARVTGLERGQIQMAIGPYLNQRIRERRAFSMYMEDLRTGNRDKLARARSIQGRMAQGMVHFPRSQPWFDAMNTELMQFPNGRHDDIVDALAWIGLMLDEMVTPFVPIDSKEKKWWKHLQMGSRDGSFMSA